MGFFDDPEAIRQAEARRTERLQGEQEVIDSFCSQRNLSRITEIVKNELRSQFIKNEGARQSSYTITIAPAFRDDACHDPLIRDSEKCREVVEQALKQIDPSLQRVTMQDEYEWYGIRLVLEF